MYAVQHLDISYSWVSKMVHAECGYEMFGITFAKFLSNPRETSFLKTVREAPCHIGAGDANCIFDEIFSIMMITQSQNGTKDTNGGHKYAPQHIAGKYHLPEHLLNIEHLKQAHFAFRCVI